MIIAYLSSVHICVCTRACVCAHVKEQYLKSLHLFGKQSRDFRDHVSSALKPVTMIGILFGALWLSLQENWGDA